MTYGFRTSALFRANSTADQNNISVNTELIVSELHNCSPHPSGGVKSSKAYVYGEVRTAGVSTDSLQIVNIAFRNTSSLIADGWQVGNNVPGSTMSDDGIYGVIDTRASMYLKSAESDPGDSDAQETRIFGIKVR